VTWVLRRGQVGNVFGGGQADALAARGALGQRARAAVEDGNVDVVTGFRTAAVERSTGTLTLVSDDNRRVDDLDEVVDLTGFRPDLSWLSEILDLDASFDTRPGTSHRPNMPPVAPSAARHAELAIGGDYLVGMKAAAGRRRSCAQATNRSAARHRITGIVKPLRGGPPAGTGVVWQVGPVDSRRGQSTVAVPPGNPLQASLVCTDNSGGLPCHAPGRGGQPVARAATSPAIGIVSTHAATMLPATPHRTAESRFVAPTPTTAEVIVWVGDQGAKTVV
jgi:hypothetical protein